MLCMGTNGYIFSREKLYATEDDIILTIKFKIKWNL